MVWGAFFGTTKDPLFFIPLNSQKAANFIKEVYKPVLVPFLQEHNPNHSWCLVLMEDSAPVHKAKLLEAFLAKYKLNNIPNWPLQSHQKRLEGPEDQHPKLVKEMQEALKKAWSNFPCQTLVKILASMPEQMKAVIKAH